MEMIMQRLLLILALLLFQNAAQADSETATQVCAEAANEVLGDTRYQLQSLRQPLTAMQIYKIQLQSETAQDVRCVVNADRLRTLTINGRTQQHK